MLRIVCSWASCYLSPPQAATAIGNKRPRSRRFEAFIRSFTGGDPLLEGRPVQSRALVDVAERRPRRPLDVLKDVAALIDLLQLALGRIPDDGVAVGHALHVAHDVDLDTGVGLVGPGLLGGLGARIELHLDGERPAAVADGSGTAPRNGTCLAVVVEDD